eukprot:g11885.t1
MARRILAALILGAWCSFRLAFVGSSWSGARAGAGSTVLRAVKGPPLTLTPENVEVVLQEARYHHLQNCFGYVEESSGAGITGKVDLMEVEGPCVFIHLHGLTVKWLLSRWKEALLLL